MYIASNACTGQLNKPGTQLVGVGSINNTFGIQGVQENTFFFKSITDASKLRRQVSECFERAALPHTPAEVNQEWYCLTSNNNVVTPYDLNNNITVALSGF